MFTKRLRTISLAITLATVVGSSAFNPFAAAATQTTGGIGLSVQENQVFSRTVTMYAGGGATQDDTISVDGVQLPTQTSDSPPATITFQGDGIQSGSQNLQNSVWVNGRIVSQLHQDVNHWDTFSISVPAGFLQPGTNVVRVRAGDGVSPTDLAKNHDDFSIRNVELRLPNGQTLTDSKYSATQQFNLGDGYPGGNATEQQVTADFNMTATAADLDGVVATWDTTKVSDGEHTVTAAGTDANGATVTQESHVIIDNSAPGLNITSPAKGQSYTGGTVNIEVNTDDLFDKIASVTGTLDGVKIPVPDSFPADNVTAGQHTLTITATDEARNSTTVTQTFSTKPGPMPAGTYDIGQIYKGPEAGPKAPVMVAVGDISCSPGSKPKQSGCQQQATADLTASLQPTAVTTLGDEQYDVGTPDNFANSYNLSWGKFKSITYPVIGNHEYDQANYPGAHAPGYFQYFNGTADQTGRAGDPNRGYYSYDIGKWHVVVLNSDCGVTSCAQGSGQQIWLKNNLADNHSPCTLAVWHHPLFSAGTQPNDGKGTKPLWDTLYKYGADVILTGHDHNYQRFAPQTSDGQADLKYGIREFVVGTGGETHFPITQPNLANLEVSNTDTFGVLKLTLQPSSYQWQFLPAASSTPNGTFTDLGVGKCHAAPPSGK